MSKLDWRNSDTGTRTNMNRPFWIASGTKSGGNLTLWVAPGSIRYAGIDAVVASGQMQTVTFGASANNYYSLFMRSDASFIVSGTTTKTITGRPRWDAECLGMVATNAFSSDADLVGPWNQGIHDPHEQRGEYVAVGSMRPRMVYDNRQQSSTTGQVRTDSSLIASSHTNQATASGLCWLTLASTALTPGLGAVQPRALLHATVQWVASGDMTASAFYVAPVFGIVNVQTVGTPPWIAEVWDAQHHIVAQDPWGSSRGCRQEHHVSFTTVQNTTTAPTGFRLMCYVDPSTDLTDTNVAPQIQIKLARLTAVLELPSTSRNELP